MTHIVEPSWTIILDFRIFNELQGCIWKATGPSFKPLKPAKPWMTGLNSLACVYARCAHSLFHPCFAPVCLKILACAYVGRPMPRPYVWGALSCKPLQARWQGQAGRQCHCIGWFATVSPGHAFQILRTVPSPHNLDGQRS